MLFIVPGWWWGGILVPTGPNAVERIGRAAFASLLITSAACTVLALLDVLMPATVVAVSIGAAGSGWLADRRNRQRGTRRITRRARRAWLATMGAIGLAGALILLPSHLRLGPDTIPASSTVWYYAHLAHEVAAVGGFPADFIEWGTSRPFQTDYAPFTAHSAAVFQLMSNDLLASQEAYRLTVLMLVLVFATLVFRRFVSTWVAVLGAVLLVTTLRLDFKLLAYKPEMFAFAVALATAWLADRAATERSWRLAGVAMAGGALVFLSHAEVFLVLVALIAAIAIARGPLRPRPGRIGLRPSRTIAGGVIAASVLVGGAVIGILGNGLIAGNFRLLGYIIGGQDPPGQADPTPLPPYRLPVGWTLSPDPTWNFYVAAAAPGEVGARPPVRFTDRRILPRSILHIWPALDGQGPEGLVLLFGLVGTPFLAWPWLDPRRRRLLLIVAVFAIALLVGSYVLNEISSTYVPRRAGGRRLMPYELLLPVVAGVCWLWGAQRLLEPGWRSLFRPRAAAVAGGLSLLLLVAAAVAPVANEEDLDEAPGLSSVGYHAYEWIRASLPADARILANAYTDGAMTALTERVSILDGRAVYLEDAAFLEDATRLVLGARRYFQTPADLNAASFLDEAGADYLLVVGPTGRGADVGGYRPFPTDYESLDASDRLAVVARFGDGTLTLFKVGEAGKVSAVWQSHAHVRDAR